MCVFIMEFYKKINKTKSNTSFLNEKQYKCASLQAIISEALKQNNKEQLKELVEEINGHLTELRTLKDDDDMKTKAKCEKLINQYEECLLKIVNKKPANNNLLMVLNEKLNDLQQKSNVAVKENRAEELKKLVEQIKMDLEVITGMPEVKNAKTLNREGDEYLKIVSTYEELLKAVSDLLSKSRRIVSDPIAMNDYQKMIQGNEQDQENTPQKVSKVGLNEVEEKLKLMRQKRLNRLSTFVDQQAKLSEERSRENSPKNFRNSNKSLENLNKISESEEIETAIKLIQQAEMVKPMIPKPAVREKIGVTSGQKESPQTVKRAIQGPEKKIQTNKFQEKISGVRNAFRHDYENVKISDIGSGAISHMRVKPQVENLLIDKQVEDVSQDELNHDHAKIDQNGETMMDIPSVRKSFGKGTITRSFAERAIENAKKKADKPQVGAKQSHSTKTTPPRTPTQIRKILNKFNSCVVKSSNTNKSLEDLPKEFNSVFEQELKTTQLKPVQLANRLKKGRENRNFARNHAKSVRSEDAPPVIPPRVEIPTPVRNKQAEKYFQSDHAKKVESREPPNTNVDRRHSVDLENITVREHQPDSSQSTDMIITIKRDSGHKPKDTERHSFSTFRASSDSSKTSDAILIENPLYGICGSSSLETSSNNTAEKSTNSHDTLLVENPLYDTNDIRSDFNNLFDHKQYNQFRTDSTFDKVFRELYFNCNSLGDLLKAATSTELKHSELMERIKELNTVLREVKRDVKEVIEKSKENTKLSKILKDVDGIENEVKGFRGFKTDPEYLSLDKQMAKYYVEIDQIRPQSLMEKNEINVLKEKLKNANQILEDNVTRNRNIMRLILEEQAEYIAKKYGKY